MLLAALQGYISRLSTILTANISTDISTEAQKENPIFHQYGCLLKLLRTTRILSNKLINVLKNVAIHHSYVTYCHKVPIRGLLAVETKNSFVLWLAKFKYQKTCLLTVSIAIIGKVSLKYR